MIRQDVSLDTALGPAELGPWKQVQAQRNEGQQLLLETELLARPQSSFVAETLERGVKQILVQLGRPVFVGIGKRGFIGGPGDADVNQFAQAAAQAVSNLA